jgi:hypothetical protein
MLGVDFVTFDFLQKKNFSFLRTIAKRLYPRSFYSTWGILKIMPNFQPNLFDNKIHKFAYEGHWGLYFKTFSAVINGFS